jgi:hypothetical protein
MNESLRGCNVFNAGGRTAVEPATNAGTAFRIALSFRLKPRCAAGGPPGPRVARHDFPSLGHLYQRSPMFRARTLEEDTAAFGILLVFVCFLHRTRQGY